MAMKPFAGYHMGDYFAHWIDMGKKVKNPPKIFNVNWFRQDEDGNFMWPGFGDNMRVLEWILKRCDENPVEADETVIGFVPRSGDIDLTDLDYEFGGKKFTEETLKEILSVDESKWAKEAQEIEGYYNDVIKSRIPQELWDCLNYLKEHCKAEEPKAEPKKTAKKPAAKTDAAKKPAAKTTAKTAAKATAKAAPAKKPAAKTTTKK